MTICIIDIFTLHKFYWINSNVDLEVCNKSKYILFYLATEAGEAISTSSEELVSSPNFRLSAKSSVYCKTSCKGTFFEPDP